MACWPWRPLEFHGLAGLDRCFDHGVCCSQVTDDIGGLVGRGGDEAIGEVFRDNPSNSNRCWSDVLIGWIVTLVTEMISVNIDMHLETCSLQDPIRNDSGDSAMGSNSGYKTQKGDLPEHD